MIVYRVLSDKDKRSREEIPNGMNTFHYEQDVDYLHFFYFYDSAILFKKIQNKTKNFHYTSIVAYDIPETILKQHFGFGHYVINDSSIETEMLLESFKNKTLLYPEFAVPSSMITQDMIIGIGDEKRIKPLNIKKDDLLFDPLYELILENQYKYLNYLKKMYELYDLYPVVYIMYTRFSDPISRKNYQEILSSLVRNKDLFFEEDGIKKYRKWIQEGNKI